MKINEKTFWGLVSLYHEMTDEYNDPKKEKIDTEFHEVAGYASDALEWNDKGELRPDQREKAIQLLAQLLKIFSKRIKAEKE